MDCFQVLTSYKSSFEINLTFIGTGSQFRTTFPRESLEGPQKLWNCLRFGEYGPVQEKRGTFFPKSCKFSTPSPPPPAYHLGKQWVPGSKKCHRMVHGLANTEIIAIYSGPRFFIYYHRLSCLIVTTILQEKELFSFYRRDAEIQKDVSHVPMVTRQVSRIRLRARSFWLCILFSILCPIVTLTPCENGGS